MGVQESPVFCTGNEKSNLSIKVKRFNLYGWFRYTDNTFSDVYQATIVDYLERNYEYDGKIGMMRYF